MGLRIEAPKQDGNARFNTLKVNLQQNLSATRGVVADEQGNFYYGVAGSGGAGFPFSGSAQITGSLGITGSINIIDGGITGSLYGTSSWAISASYVANAPTAETASYVLSSNVDGPLGMDSILSASYSVSSSNSRTASYAFNAETASFVTASSVFGPYGSSSIESASYAVSTSYTNYAVTASHALTASSADDFLVRGTLTAQTIVAQIITSSTQYITGSTIFGSELTNTHVFTGSVSITGSLDVYGPANFYGPITGSIYGTASYAPNIYNSDGELTGNRVMSGSQYNLTLDPSLTFNSSIVGYSRKTFYSNAFSTTTSSFNTASVLISANTTQSGSLGGLYGLINNIHVIAENQGNNTQGVAIGYQSNTQLTGVYTSSRMYVVGSRVLVSRFGVSSSLDQSNNANNYLAGQEIITTYNGFSGGVTSSYTGQHLGLSVVNTIVNGNIGDLYGVRVQNNISNFTTYTGSATNNYYGIRLQASIGTTSAAITSSIQNYYAAHISSISIGATGRITNLYGVYAEDSRMAHYFNGNVGIKTTRPAYEIDVVGSTRTQTTSNFGILANPTGLPTATPSTTGGALADGTYYYSITALDNYYAQTTGSAIASASISGGGGSGSVQLSWTAVPGATYYVIHRGTTLGTFNTAFQSAQITNTFTDVGGTPAAWTFPTNNFTAITRVNSNGDLNVGSGIITFGNTVGPPLRTLEIRRGTGWGVKTGIIIGSANTSFPSAYPDNQALPFVFGEFNTLTGSRYYVIGDENNMTAGTAPDPRWSLFIGYNTNYVDGINSIVIGRGNHINTSRVDNGCSITIGRSNVLNHRSILIGTQVESTADGQLVIGQNNPSENLTIRDVYFGNGIRNKFDNVNANFGNGFNVTINGSGPTASADLAGGSLILAGGKGTGTGTPGDLIFSTSTRLASGVTLQSLSQRVWIKGDTGNVGIGTSSPTLANLQVQGNVWALSYTGSLFGTASYAPNLYNSDGTTTGTRTVTLGSNTLYFNSTRATGSAVEIVLNQTQPNSTETNDIALVADYNITANSATNQLVVRPFVLKARNTLTGGGAVQNLRAFNLASYFNSSTTTTNADLIYLENGIGAGTVTNYRGIRIANFYGTNRAGVAMAPIGGTNGSYILIGTDVIPSGFWGVYQSENTYSNYFAGNVGIGTTVASAKLSVVGATNIIGATTISGSFSNTGVFSIQRLDSSTGTRQIVITSEGVAAGNISTAPRIICIGANSGNSLTGSAADSLIAIGQGGGGSLTVGGRYSIHIGRNSGGGITAGEFNTIIGSGDQTNIPANTNTAIHLIAGAGYELNDAASVLGPLVSNYAFIGGGYNASRFINNFYFGSAPFTIYPANSDLNFYAPSATGSTADLQGPNFTINAGRGTGTGTPGDFIVATSATGSSGIQNQTLLNRVWIKGNSGNVGIGISSPAYKLDVNGSLRATSSVLLPGLTTSPQSNVITIDTTTGQLYYTASSAIGGGASLSGGATNYVARWASSTTLTTGSIFDNGTSVGIGTITPTASLHLVGNSDTSSFVLYTEATGGLGSFRIYNDVRGISNPGISSSFRNETFGFSAMQSSSMVGSNLDYNTAFGAFAMENARNIRLSVAVGYNTLWNAIGTTTSITGSTAVGINALAYQQAGLYNTAIGFNALRGISVDTGSTGDRNTAVGGSALAFNTTGQRNNAFGDSALGFNTVGSFNTANGNRALIFNVSGSYNTALGVDSLRSSTTASYGTAVGGQALYDSLTGDRNIAIGWDSGRGITSGRANTIIGSATGLSAALSNNIILADGDGNIRAWHNAVSWSLSTPVVANDGITGSLFGTSSWAVSASWAPNTGGSSQWTSSGANIYFNVGNVGVGTNSPAYPFDVSGNTRLVGSLAVGNITPSGTSGRIDASNDIVAFSSSDIRFKTNLKPIDNPIDKINKVSGYEFDWIPDQENHGHEGHDIGVIAQEIEQILPEIVTTRESGYKAVKYEKIVPLLIEAIKEQQKQIDELRYLLQNK